ncbi:MAG: hypothetical protein JW936_07600 [Sedimentisphaerales bacterium]|nr:hypothetical protein [Sedimentisphaerales bacterium]
MNSELTEILIGKFLDSEITPAEQRLLEAELQRNPQAKQLLESLRTLRDQAEEALSEALPGGGEGVAEVFDRAWQQSKPQRRAVNSINRYGRWAAAIAIGFVLGSMFQQHTNSIGPSLPMFISGETHSASVDNGVRSGSEAAMIGDMIQSENEGEDQSGNVEWYTYSDGEGNQWLIENRKSDMITPVVYAGAL